MKTNSSRDIESRLKEVFTPSYLLVEQSALVAKKYKIYTYTYKDVAIKILKGGLCTKTKEDYEMEVETVEMKSRPEYKIKHEKFSMEFKTILVNVFAL